MNKGYCAVWMGVLLGLYSSVLYAQPSDQNNREAAREHFIAGVNYANQHRWREAISELETARRLGVTPAVLYNLGVAYRSVGESREAVATLQSFLQLVGNEIQPDRRAVVEQLIVEQRESLVHLSITVEPPNALIWVDGNEVLSGAATELNAGQHSVVIQAEEYQTESRVVNFSPGATESITIALRRVDRPGRLDLHVTPEQSVITIDGQRMGTGSTQIPVVPGEHMVRVSAVGYQTWERRVSVRTGETLRLDAYPNRIQYVWSSPWFWTGIAVGVAAIGVITAFSVPVEETAAGAETWSVVTF